MRASAAATAAARPQPAALDQDLGFTLGVIFRAYLNAAHAVVSDIPGGPRGYQVLVAAVQHQAGGQGALAQRLGVDRTVMTYLIDDLEEAGLVERRPDPLDRRSRHIVATRQGQQRCAETEQRLREVEEHVLGALSNAERASLRGMLQRLAAHATALDAVADACDVINDVSSALESDRSAPEAPSLRRRSSRHRRGS